MCAWEWSKPRLAGLAVRVQGLGIFVTPRIDPAGSLVESLLPRLHFPRSSVGLHHMGSFHLRVLRRFVYIHMHYSSLIYFEYP